MLKFNSFRSSRYYRTKFTEGRYLLASENTDLELEIFDTLRKTFKSNIGDVAIGNAWNVTRYDVNKLLVNYGEAWFNGIMYELKAGADWLLTPGTAALGIQLADEVSGLGKVIVFSDVSTTPSDTYRIVITASEQVINSIDDPFLQNVNISEPTASKIRLVYTLNVVKDSNQGTGPDYDTVSFASSYVGETGSATTTVLANTVKINPSATSGSLVSITDLTTSQQIDGRSAELVILNPSGTDQFPSGFSDQALFENGTLIDSLGNEYHINAIFNGNISGQVVLRISREVGQADPVIPLTSASLFPSYYIKKQELYYADDTTGVPTGKLHWHIASAVWDSSSQFVHPSVVTDLRNRIINEDEFEDVINQKFNIQLTGGGVINVDVDGQTLNWTADFTLVNPSGPVQTIAASSAVLLPGGTLAYTMNLAGGAIAVGNQAVTVSSILGNVVSFSGSPDLTNVKVGNVFASFGAEYAAITAINNVSKTITVSPAVTSTGLGTIYRDSYAPGTVPLKETLFIIAALQDSKITVGGILELGAGESNAIYDVRTQFTSGLPALTNIILPNNTQTSKPQYYDATKRNLTVYQNQLLKFQGVDWIAIDNKTIQFTHALTNNTEIHFRIDSMPAGSIGGGGSGGGAGTLQEAYNGGNTIAVLPGLPLSVSGISGKIAEFLGDITVTGVIDPAGMELTPQSTNPLAVAAAGIWVNTPGQLMHTDGIITNNVTQQIADITSGATNPLTAGVGLTKLLNDIYVNVDNSTLEIPVDTIQVKAAGITETHLNTSIAGAGLSGGAGSPLAINVDASTIEILLDTLQVKDLGIVTGKLAAKAVTDAKLSSDSSVDANRAVGTDHIKDSAVTSDKLATSVAGAGLSGGAGSSLSVNVDNSTLEIPVDTLQVKDSGITTAKINNAAVDADKLASSVAGAGLTGGAGSALAVGAGYGVQVNADTVEVLYSPAVRISATAGQAFSANVTYLVRWAITGETSGRLYKADAGIATNNKYIAIGALNSGVAILAGDTVSVLLEGAQALGIGDTPFNSTDIGLSVFLRDNGSGGFTVSAPTTVGSAQYKVGVVETTTSFLVDNKHLSSVVPVPLYDERFQYPSGLPVSTDITIPVNSRNGGAAQTYTAASGSLQVYLNQQFKFQDIDWTVGTSPTTQIKFNYALTNDSEVHFRIEPATSGILTGAGGGGGGGSGSLQDAYNTGNIINVLSGTPITINGPASQKLLVVNGDIDVTGIIDPTALQLTPQSSNPLAPGDKGIWINTANHLIHSDGTSDNNISAQIASLQSGTGIPTYQKSYLNSTGTTIPAFSPVYSPSSGQIALADGNDINKYRVIGVTSASITSGNSGYVAISGILTGISATHNRYLFLDLAPGTLTDIAPTLGSYPSGFNIVRLGVVEGNNLIMQMQHMGVL